MSTFSPDTGEKKVCFNAKMLHTFIKKGGQIFLIYNLLTFKSAERQRPNMSQRRIKGDTSLM